MEIINEESDVSLLTYITQDDIPGEGIQIIAYAFECVQYDITKKVLITSFAPGTVKLRKLPDGSRCIAMYGVVPIKNVNTNDHLINFKKCLNKIATIKNLKSIAFSKDTFGDKQYTDLLEEFAEKVDALVYVYSTKKPEVIHKSFGDLLSQIKLWKNQHAGWDQFFQARIKDKTISTLNAFLQKEAEEYNIYPSPEEIFNAMILTKVSNIKVIIIGQNPYYVPNAAMGLAFSHKDEYGKLQPSLRNIYKELVDCGYKVNKKSGNLTKWATRGVFLINTGLTVRQGQSDSHMKEWAPFTEHLFKFLNKEIPHAVIIMWGGPAQNYSKYFDNKKHKKIMSSHPCPMSANISFFGSKPFIKCNQYLKEWSFEEIDWNLV
jgi:uracil-DNA glycosylase